MFSSIVVFGTVRFGAAQSNTNVSGIIASNTTWTQANSPYTFTGPVSINASITLTIQAGVIVNIGSYYLQVNGTLYAQGSQTNHIYINTNSSGFSIIFTPLSSSWNEQTATGCIIQNAVLNQTSGSETGLIDIENVSPKIDNNAINYFSNYPETNVIEISGSPIISNNNITMAGAVYGISISSGSPIISNNTIHGTQNGGSWGIFSFGNSYISGNVISGCDYGIESANSATITRNMLYNNTNEYGTEGYAIKVSGSGNSLIENNTIINSPYGIYIYNAPDDPLSVNITNNNIYRNGYDIYCSSSSNINATYNWWGTTDTQAIKQTIYDFKNDFNSGNVTFVPFLTTPVTEAPTCVLASVSAGGSISPSGIIRVNYDGIQGFAITPNTGYSILAVSVNGTSVGAVSSYIVQNIEGTTTISATFAPNPTLTPASTTSLNSTVTSTPITQSSPSPTHAIPEFPTLIVLPLFAVAMLLSMILIRKTTPKK
jgi:parallel beta-helix repeat protein